MICLDMYSMNKYQTEKAKILFKITGFKIN